MDGREEEWSKIVWDIEQQSAAIWMTHVVLETTATKSENFMCDRIRITVGSMVEQCKEKIIFALCNTWNIGVTVRNSCYCVRSS